MAQQDVASTPGREDEAIAAILNTGFCAGVVLMFSGLLRLDFKRFMGGLALFTGSAAAAVVIAIVEEETSDLHHYPSR